MPKYTVSVEIDIPYDRNGRLVASPSAVLSKLASDVSWLGDVYLHAKKDQGQCVTGKCSRIKKVKEQGQ